MYVDSGSVYEDEATAGSSHLLEYLAFRGTAHRSHLRLVREVEAIGGAVVAAASREQAAFAVDAPAASAAAAAEVAVDAALFPSLAAHEVHAAAERLAADSKKLEDAPQTLLLEGAHAVAYEGGLARPLVASPEAAAALDPEAVVAFHAATFSAPRVVVAGAGVEHQALVDAVAPLLEALPSAAGPAAPASTYVGGDWRRANGSPETHVVLAFPFAGGWRDLDGSVAATVAQYLLGGGGSFSAGGPGKGMHSLLHLNVLNNYGWVSHASALASIHNDAGIVGVYAAGDSARAGDLVSVAADQLARLASPVAAAELERAKAAAVSSVLMNLESRAVVAEDVGRQVLTYGQRKDVDAFVSAIKALTPEALAARFADALKKPPTLATLGNVAAVPRYDVLAKHFN